MRLINHVKCFNAPFSDNTDKILVAASKWRLDDCCERLRVTHRPIESGPDFGLSARESDSSELSRIYLATVPKRGVLCSGVVEYVGERIANHPRIEQQIAGDERPYRTVWTKPRIGVTGIKLLAAIKIGP